MAGILKNQIPEIEELTVTKGSGGVFEITVDKKLVFSKKKLGRFPEDDEAVRLVANRGETADAVH